MADAGELKATVSAETSQFISAMNDVAQAAQNASDQAAQGFQPVDDALTHVGESAHEASGFLGELREGFSMAAEIAGFTVGLEQAVELIKDIATEAVEAYSKIELMTAGMTALTGSAAQTEAVLEQLKELAGETVFSFPDLATAAQKMSALGIAAEDIPGVLTAAADAAEALGEPLQGVAQALDNVYTRGQLTLRQLPQLGLTWQDLAEAMGGTADNAKEALAQFNALSDPMDKVNTLTDAMQQKFGGAADAMKDTLSVQVNNLKVQWDAMLEDFGKEIAPNLKQVLADLQSLMPVLQNVVSLVAQLVNFSFDQLKQGFSDVKGLVDEVNGKLATVQGWLDGAAGKIQQWTGINLTATSSLATQLNDLTDNSNRTSTAFTTLGQNATQTAANTKAFHDSLDAGKPKVSDYNDTLGALNKTTVTTIAQLKEMGLAGQAPDPFKSLDDSAQKAFDTFERGFQGVDDDWNKAAAGIDPTKLLGDLQKLQAEFVQAGADGKTAGQDAAMGYIQVTDAINTLDDWFLNHIEPDSGKAFTDIQTQTQKTIDAMTGSSGLFTKINAEIAKAPLDPLTAAMKQLGIEGTTSMGKISADLTALDTLLGSHIATMGDLDGAWVKLTSDASKYANDPSILPQIIDKEKQVVSALQDQGAPLGDIYTKTGQILTQEITLATQRGQDATQFITDLTNLKIKQDALNTSATLSGTTYQNLMTDVNNAFTALGNNVSKAIMDGGSWNDLLGALKTSVENLAGSILNTLVNSAMKELETSLLGNTNLVQGLMDKLSGLFKMSSSSATSSGTPGLSLPKMPGVGGTPTSPGSGEAGAEGSAVGDNSTLSTGDMGIGDTGGEVGDAGSSASSGASSIGSSLGSVMGIVGAVGSAVSAVSGIISNFQMAHQTDIMKSIELNTRLTAMFIGGLGDGGVQTWTNLTAQYTSKLMDLDTWIHDAWVELLTGVGTLITITSASGWLHDYLANGLGPQVDQLVGNTTQIVGAINALAGITSGTPGAGGPNAAQVAADRQAANAATQADLAEQQKKLAASMGQSGGTTIEVNVNTPALVTKDAANILGNRIASSLGDQLAGSSLR